MGRLLGWAALMYHVAMSRFARLRESLGPALRAAVVALPLLSAGCGVTLLDQRVEGEAKEWHLAVTKVEDGPDETSHGRTRLLAGPGNRFLHLHVSLKNLGDETRSWNWPRCGLDHGQDEYLPILVRPVTVTMRHAFLTDGLKESLFRGEEVLRLVIVNYPTGDILPTRLKCGDIVLPLRLKQ